MKIREIRLSPHAVSVGPVPGDPVPVPTHFLNDALPKRYSSVVAVVAETEALVGNWVEW